MQCTSRAINAYVFEQRVCAAYIVYVACYLHHAMHVLYCVVGYTTLLCVTCYTCRVLCVLHAVI